MNRRVLLAGLFHETHTFLEGSTGQGDFQVRTGSELLEAEGDGSPLAGVLEVARQCGWRILPTVDYRAQPSDTVEDAVFDRFWHEFQELAQPHLEQGLDAIYLVLHGAMVCRSWPDVEGEFLRRIRELPGAQNLPLGGVVDLHANFTAAMARHSDSLVAYRENPHADAHQAAVDAARLLERILADGRRPVTLWEHPPIVWPPTGTGTADDPMRTLESMARGIEAADSDILAVNILAGFSFADIPETGVSFTAVTTGPESKAREKLHTLAQWAVANRKLGNRIDQPLSEVLPRLSQLDAGPVLLVEPSDNVAGGGPGDGTGLLRALVEHKVPGAAVAICDAQAVSALADVAIGDTRTLSIGGKGSALGGAPVVLPVVLVSRSNGQFELEDRQSHLASMCGSRFDMGPSAVVRHDGMHILLTTRKTPPFDLAQWRSQGLNPEQMRVIVVKAAIAHRRAYDPITHASFTVDTPGPCSSNLKSLPYRRIQRPIFPLDE